MTGFAGLQDARAVRRQDTKLMSTSLILTSGSWARVGSTRARGQAYDASGTLLRASQLAALFDACRTRKVGVGLRPN